MSVLLSTNVVCKNYPHSYKLIAQFLNTTFILIIDTRRIFFLNHRKRNWFYVYSFFKRFPVYTGDSFHHVTYMHGSLIVFVSSRTINECPNPAAEKLDLWWSVMFLVVVGDQLHNTFSNPIHYLPFYLWQSNHPML
jgi:hypothetical protein